MWTGLVDWAKSHLLTQPPLVSAKDVAIPLWVHTADEAIVVLREHQARWRAEDAETRTGLTGR